jgi:hypothetical protein
LAEYPRISSGSCLDIGSTPVGTLWLRRSGARNAEAVVKWTKRARTPTRIRARTPSRLLIAESVPLGPTLLEIPFDLLVGEGYGDIRT